MKIWLITTVVGETDLLPHFLDYYRRAGVDEVLVLLNGSLKDSRRVGSLLSGFNASIVRRYEDGSDHGFKVKSDWERWAQRSRCGRRDWVVSADIDEFHQFPFGLRATVHLCQEKGYTYVRGEMLDRVAADGSFPPVPDARGSLWEDFPVACSLTKAIMHGMTKKVLVRRGDVEVSQGHHLLAPRERGGVRDRPLKQAGVTHHFKWNRNALARTRLRAEMGCDRPEIGEARRLLTFLGGGRKLDLSQGELRPAPAVLRAPPDCRTVHQIWLGGGNPPRRHLYWMRKIREMHPGWRYRLWRDEDAAEFALFREHAHRARHHSERSDLLRFLLLERYGGLYLDTDCEGLQPFDPLVDLAEIRRMAFAGEEAKTRFLGTAVLFSPHPEHPAFVRLVDGLAGGIDLDTDYLEATGPRYAEKLLRGRGDVTIYPPSHFYPLAFDDRGFRNRAATGAGDSYTIHHWAGSWLPAEASGAVPEVT